MFGAINSFLRNETHTLCLTYYDARVVSENRMGIDFLARKRANVRTAR